MFELIAANAATIVIGVILLAAVIAALRYTVKKAKSGGCAGCNCGCGEAGCSASSACSAKK